MGSAQTKTNSTMHKEGIWSTSPQINHTEFFHSTFTFAYHRCLLTYANSKEYKVPQRANTRVKNSYSATRACEAAETWSFKHYSGTGLRNYKFSFWSPTAPSSCNVFDLSYGIPAESKLNNGTDKQIMSLLWVCFVCQLHSTKLVQTYLWDNKSNHRINSFQRKGLF